MVVQIQKVNKYDQIIKSKASSVHDSANNWVNSQLKLQILQNELLIFQFTDNRSRIKKDLCNSQFSEPFLNYVSEIFNQVIINLKAR